MKKLKSMGQAFEGTLGTVPAEPSLGVLPGPSTDRRVKRPPGDLRTQPFQPPLAVEAFAAEAPDIKKQRQGILA